MSLRDAEREQRFLRAAARHHEPFAEHAAARLAAGEEPFGDNWARIGIRRHLAELLEEAADLGAWATLAEQALDREALSDVDRQRIGAVLQLAGRCGAQAHEALTGAVRALDGRHAPGPERPAEAARSAPRARPRLQGPHVAARKPTGRPAMTPREQQPRYAQAPALRGQGPAAGNRINARLEAGERQAEQNYADRTRAGGAGGSFAVMVFSRNCPTWTVRDWAVSRPVVSGVGGWVL